VAQPVWEEGYSGIVGIAVAEVIKGVAQEDQEGVELMC